MNIDFAEELSNLVYEILEPHAAYIHNENDDDIRYFVSPEVLVALTWIATNIIIPILTGAASSIILERIRKRKKEGELKAMQMKEKLNEIELLKKEVESNLQRSRKAQSITDKNIVIAEVTLSEVLEINGWPSEVAKRDAETSVQVIYNRLKSIK